MILCRILPLTFFALQSTKTSFAFSVGSPNKPNKNCIGYVSRANAVQLQQERRQHNHFASSSLNQNDETINNGADNSMGTGVEDRDDHVRLLDASLKSFTEQRGIREFIRSSSPSLSMKNEDGIEKYDEENIWFDIHTNTRFALISHNAPASNQFDGPTHTYGNYAALSAFGFSWSELVFIPTVRTARVSSDQSVWAETLENLRRSGKGNGGILEGYQGFRCTRDETVFFIKDALLWNCFDDAGKYFGQALLFDREKVTFM